MLKTIAFPSLVLVLVLSLLAPSLLPFLDKEHTTTFILETEKKENKKEIEKKCNEKAMFEENYVALAHDFSPLDRQCVSFEYLFRILEEPVETLDPPPRSVL